MGDDIYGYAYDLIGNRQWSAVNAATNTYAANGLNQYSLITNHVNHVNPVQILPAYDLDGNMLTYNGWIFAWSGENRLIQASNALHLVTYAYDHQGRMIQKVVDGASRSFLWDGWNIIAEQLMHSGTNELMNYYVWGLDLDGTLQDAGGVGGLLAVSVSNPETLEPLNPEIFYPCFDANGNVTEFVNENGDVRAHYEYSPFGEITAQSGDMAGNFTHRFSTKPFDVETGLVMYELRPYEPDLGRWLTRDPIGENGFFFTFRENATSSTFKRAKLLINKECCHSNLYLFPEAINQIDLFGLKWWDPRTWFSKDSKCCKNKDNEDLIAVLRNAGTAVPKIGVIIQMVNSAEGCLDGAEGPCNDWGKFGSAKGFTAWTACVECVNAIFIQMGVVIRSDLNAAEVCRPLLNESE